MKVKVYNYTYDDGRAGLQIIVDGKVRCNFLDGEPEDNSLGRNFDDCYTIVDLMREAYIAGSVDGANEDTGMIEIEEVATDPDGEE